MEDTIIKEFPVTVYGNLTKYSDTISKARCRIFYKYANRNGTFISDTFAEKLLSTIPYTPVKGIYKDTEDFSDHGKDRSNGRIYGIVPEKPNLAWETHEDEDGRKRVYACVDVLIFTALYEEAGEIVGKPQSMEIYEPSISGAWKMIAGQRLFEFTEGSFLGLQVLGDEVEPCFEGAAFFELYGSMKDLLSEIKEYELKLSNLKKGGQLQMQKINFKLSDSQKHQAIWNLLNVNCNEAGDWRMDYCICEIYDEYALAYNLTEETYERVYYTKDDKAEVVSIGEIKKAYIVDVTEAEKSALETLHALNGGTYEKVEEIFDEASNLLEESFNYAQKIEELTTNLATLEAEKETFTTQLDEANAKVEALTKEVDSLSSYKEKIELTEREEVIASYSELLSEDILNLYTEKISEYSAIELDKELAYELKKNSTSIFTKNATPNMIPKDEPQGGIERILSKYKNKNMEV